MLCTRTCFVPVRYMLRTRTIHASYWNVLRPRSCLALIGTRYFKHSAPCTSTGLLLCRPPPSHVEAPQALSPSNSIGQPCTHRYTVARPDFKRVKPLLPAHQPPRNLSRLFVPRDSPRHRSALDLKGSGWMRLAPLYSTRNICASAEKRNDACAPRLCCASRNNASLGGISIGTSTGMGTRTHPTT